MDLRPAKIDVTLLQPNLAPTKLSIEERNITLGRASDCTIPIKDRFLSRKHAEIFFDSGIWLVKDCGSANGTFVNGVRVADAMALKPGDRISLGDSEVLFQSQLSDEFAVADSTQTSGISIPLKKAVQEDFSSGGRATERLQILNALAVELIEDRPMSDLFEFILDRVMHLMKPSRAALALLADDKKSFLTVKIRRREQSDSMELRISKTLLHEVVEEKRVLSFIDVAENEKLGQALSIIGQSIRSALCAPLIVGESVVGVLYVDYLMSHSSISEEDARLMAQIARIAAIKLETTRLREEALAKQRMEEELRTAYTIQSRLLPSAPPKVEGYSFAAVNRPCRTVSGDYYDYVVKESGKVYFVIADVSGKGITAALVMASLEAAFVIFTRNNPSPAELLEQLNVTLVQKLAPTKFVTMFAAILDPLTGEIEFANAGHTPPVHVHADGVSELKTTDMVIGLFAQAKYRNQKLALAEGDSLILFTDGIIEAENAEGVELGSDRVREILMPMHRRRAVDALTHLEERVMNFVGTVPLGDDVTIVALNRG